MDGSRGRIPNWATKRVEEDVKKHGFNLAFHYFAYDSIVDDMPPADIQLWRAFSKYGRDHNIPEDKFPDDIEELYSKKGGKKK